MTWIDRAERKFGHLDIPGLIRWASIFNAFVFVCYKLYPPVLDWLMLDPDAVTAVQLTVTSGLSRRFE